MFFLADLLSYIDENGKKKKAYLLMNISTDVDKWVKTYDFEKKRPANHYLHSKFINKPGVMVYEKAVLLPAGHIKNIGIKELDFELNTLSHVDRILSKIPESDAPPSVKSFYDQNFGNKTLNKSKKSKRSRKSKIRELLDNRLRKRTLISEILGRSKRNRRITESYRDY